MITSQNIFTVLIIIIMTLSCEKLYFSFIGEVIEIQKGRVPCPNPHDS